MKTYKSIAKIFIMAALVLTASGCASGAQYAANEQTAIAAEDSPIIADPNSSVHLSRVEVRTLPAPTPETAPATAHAEHEAPSPPDTRANAAVSPVPPSSPASVASPLDGLAWINATMAKYGVYPQAGTRFVIGPMPAGCEGAHGCTGYTYHPATGEYTDYIITILPGQLTEYLLIHEIAHASGIRGECAADDFTRSILGAVPGYYC